MSIQEFYKKFVSASENSALTESLRRLSLLDDPKTMFEVEPMAEWAIWTEVSEGFASSQA